MTWSHATAAPHHTAATQTRTTHRNRGHNHHVSSSERARPASHIWTLTTGGPFARPSPFEGNRWVLWSDNGSPRRSDLIGKTLSARFCGDLPSFKGHHASLTRNIVWFRHLRTFMPRTLRRRASAVDNSTISPILWNSTNTSIVRISAPARMAGPSRPNAATKASAKSTEMTRPRSTAYGSLPSL